VGSWNVPGNMMANIHAGEMIIPKPFAQSLREGGGLTGGQMTVVINANDAASVAAWANSNSATLAKAVGNFWRFNPSARPQF